MFQEKMSLETEGKEPQQQRQITKEGSEKLKESIRMECEAVANDPKIHEMAKDTDKCWRLWSNTVERGWVRNVDEQKIFDTRFTGRGKVEIITKSTRDEKGRRKKRYFVGKEAREEITAVRQARRCEQMAFRIMLTKAPGEVNDKTIKYTKLNNEAIDKLKKHKGDETWEK